MFKRFFSRPTHETAHNRAGKFHERLTEQWRNVYHSTRNRLSQGAQSIFRAVRVARMPNGKQHSNHVDHQGHRKF